jgi:hypothetical protein
MLSWAHLVALVVQHHESDAARRDERSDERLVELIHRLEKHIVRVPHRLVHHVQCRVYNELVEMAILLLLARELGLVQRVVLLPDDDENVRRIRVGVSHAAVGGPRLRVNGLCGWHGRGYIATTALDQSATTCGTRSRLSTRGVSQARRET